MAQSSHGFKVRTLADQTSASYLGYLPEIDTSRLTAVYVRQSDIDADGEHGESRQTQLSLVQFAMQLRRENHLDSIRLYDEGVGKSGQLRIDERAELRRLYHDAARGEIGTIIVAREDRLFRDKHGKQVAVFTEMAERVKLMVIVPALHVKASLKLYDFTQFTHLRAFQRKMQDAYDYIEYHVGYMHLNQRNKASRGGFDGRNLPPGLVIPRNIDKACQVPVLYQPWADQMKWVFARLRELNWHVGRMNREIELLPYLFPMPSKEDYDKYLFCSVLTKVPGGFKPFYAGTLKRWLLNVQLIGWWIVDRESNEVLIDNHPAVIERELFEEGYMCHTGYTLEGVPVPEKQLFFVKRALRGWKTPPPALLHGKVGTPHGYVFLHKNGPHLYYSGKRSDKGAMYDDTIFSIPVKELDRIIVARLEELAARDRHLAEKIQQQLEQVHAQRAEECLDIDDQLRVLDRSIKQLKKRVATIEELFEEIDDQHEDLDEDDEDDPLKRMALQLKEFLAQRAALLLKKQKLNIVTKEEIVEFYDTLNNFRVQWPKLSLEQQQKLISLLARKIEVTSLSPHWIQLTVHWIGAVSPDASMRPDPALIWRIIPAHQPPIEGWELTLITQQYPLVQRREDLLSQLPRRTWHALSKQAHLLHLKKPYQRFPDDDIPEYACWNDVIAIPDRQEALRMIREAKTSCSSRKHTCCAFWLLPADFREINHSQLLDPSLNYNRCTMVAIPCPTPMHMVASP
jgi:hypothetical protein